MKAALFDMDGTITDSLESIAHSCNTVLKEFGYPEIELERYKTLVGDGAETLIRRALKSFDVSDEDQIRKVYKRYLEVFEDGCLYHVTPCRGVPELIEKMKAKGMKIAVCSNKPHAKTVKVADAVYPKGTFDMVIGQKDDIPKKPAPDMALMAAKEFGVEPSECMYLGDTNTDMKTGIAAGMFTIGVLWGFRDRAELEEFHPNAIVSTAEEVEKFLDM
ncbi:phosphoglycolate phosphatase [Lachnospiraceae bacterium]|nr:phosphoglycolate phosphatase [Lachnospiraceae bacterium]